MNQKSEKIKRYVSNCCNAGVFSDTDICTDCKEHCGVGTIYEDFQALIKHECRINNLTPVRKDEVV